MHATLPPGTHQVPARPAAGVPDATGTRIYTVKAGDSLSLIARHFYHDARMWPHIYRANRDHIGADPNLIYPGQRLTIPRGARGVSLHLPERAAAHHVPRPRHHGATASWGGLPGVPAQAARYIRQAAAATGMPVGVVAAQNKTESSYGENMGPSSAGAMGPWQFEPYTWPSYSAAPFSEATNWHVSTQAYIGFMRHLLSWSQGNVRMALAAYNAGPGNWQAGLGYADGILNTAAH